MILVKIFKILLFLLALLFLIWNICFDFTIGYILLPFFLLLFLKPTRFFSIYFTATFLYLLALPFTLQQYNKNTSTYFTKITQGQQLSYKEKTSIYGLNILIGIIALPIYPEVAIETLLLLFPTQTGKRVFNNDFFMQSKAIQKALNNRQKKVSWPLSNYQLGHKESRFALALNPCTLQIKETANKTQIMAQVQVKYPPNLKVNLLSQPIKISVQEGLFAYLQNIGWLHPYEAVWVYEKEK